MKRKSSNSLEIEKKFFNRLFKEKEVSMVDFMDEIGALHRRYGTSYLDALIGLWSIGGNLIQAREEKTGEVYDQFSKAIESPKDYCLIIQDVEAAEDKRAETSDWKAVPGSETVIDEGLVNYDVRAQKDVLVIGDLEKGMLMYERIRAFTQFIATRLFNRDFTCVQEYFHSSWTSKAGTAGLQERYMSLEEEHGGFELFDEVKVLSVYAGEGSDRKVFEEIKLPKGLKRAQRRGSSIFKLISRVTPNGMPLLHADVFMEIISEDGAFKIVNIEFRSNL